MMNLLELYEVFSKTDSIPVFEKNIMVDYPLNVILNSEGEDIHSLIDSFAIILWRNNSDGKVVTSINFSPPILTYVEDRLSVGMTKIHRHDYIEMAFVVKGEFSQMVGGQRLTFPQGSVCIIDRNTEHADYVKDQDNFVIFICMKENFFDEILLSEIENNNVQQFIRKALLEQKSLKQLLQFTPRGQHDVLLPLIDQVCAEKCGNQKGANYIVKGLMIRIFFILTMDYYEINLTKSQKKQINDLLFLEVEEYLRKNYQDASLKELTSRFHFQQDYFARLIKKHTGLTFSEYLRKIRISKAEELLLNTRMTTTQIIESIGYKNRNHFYNVFHAIHNMTPEQFRQNISSKSKVENRHNI
jgi:AraC-like DNA-binding protein